MDRLREGFCRSHVHKEQLSEDPAKMSGKWMKFFSSPRSMLVGLEGSMALSNLEVRRLEIYLLRLLVRYYTYIPSTRAST